MWGAMSPSLFIYCFIFLFCFLFSFLISSSSPFVTFIFYCFYHWIQKSPSNSENVQEIKNLFIIFKICEPWFKKVFIQYKKVQPVFKNLRFSKNCSWIDNLFIKFKNWKCPFYWKNVYRIQKNFTIIFKFFDQIQKCSSKSKNAQPFIKNFF